MSGVEIETHGISSEQDETFRANHQVLSRRGIVLDNLTNLDHLLPIDMTLERNFYLGTCYELCAIKINKVKS